MDLYFRPIYTVPQLINCAINQTFIIYNILLLDVHDFKLVMIIMIKDTTVGRHM